MSGAAIVDFESDTCELYSRRAFSSLSTILSQATPASQLTMSDSASKFTSPAFINGIYIPSGLLIFGCFIVKSEWLPYAIALSAALAGWKIFDSCTSTTPFPQHEIYEINGH